MTGPSPADAGPDSSRDIRPLVARGSANVGPWVFGVIALVGATGLFAALDANRRAVIAPATRPPVADFGSGGSRIPPLQLPADADWTTQGVPYAITDPYLPSRPPFRPTFEAPQDGRADSPANPPQASGPGAGQAAASPYVLPPPASGPATVYDSGSSRQLPPGAQEEAGRQDQKSGGPERVRSGRLLNPSATIVQGAIIQAVLETALDSTRAGLARAIVSRDVRGFDGVQVLVPRGSRLVGEYEADLSAGQNRALVMWTRLIRPDGVTINLQSPAADALGRAGVKGKVNSHFFERFGGAILQSALDLGVGLGTRSVVGGTVIVGLPGSTTTTPQINPDANKVRPTVSVRQGSSVSVFVARDLDFSGAGSAP